MTLYRDVAGKQVSTVIPLCASEGNLFDKKLRSFIDAIQTGGRAPVPAREILYNQAIINAVIESAKLRREVAVSLPPLE